MLKGLFILGTCAASALALSVATEIVPLGDVVAATSEFSCEFRDAFQLDRCAPRTSPRAADSIEVARQDTAPGQPLPEPGRAPKPWDDPKWDDMVAAKLLDILLKMPEDGVRTGSLSESGGAPVDPPSDAQSLSAPKVPEQGR